MRIFKPIIGAPLTSYIEENGNIVRKDGTKRKVHCINLEYCLAQKEFGSWVELESVPFEDKK